MARRLGSDFDGSDFNFEGDDLPTIVGAAGGNDPDMSTPNFFDGSDVVQPPWNPGGNANVPPTGQTTSPQDIAPDLFNPAPSGLIAGDQFDPSNMVSIQGGSSGSGGAGGAGGGGGWTPLPPTGPIPTTSGGGQVGSGTPWANGASAPSSAPPGYHWDSTYAMFMPNATSSTTNTGGIPATGRTSDQNAILAQIAQWASMPGADPSLASDPMYWYGAITSKGGLGQDNLKYWQDASVGPSAFFNNPNREGSSGGSTGGTNPGASATSGNFGSLLSQLQSMFGAPNSTPSSAVAPNGAGMDLTAGLNQVGQTPFDKQMDASLSDLLTHGGASPYGRTIEATLSDLISRGGVTPNMTAQLTQARDANAGAMAGQTADARAELAARGLGSPHGAGQGPETTAIGRISQSLAPGYASAVTDINNHAIDVANSSVMSALTMATGMSEADATSILNTVGTGTARQTALANIALKSLEDNMQWNEFLANFGLQKDQIAEQLQQGRLAALTPLLNLFLLMSGQSAQGFIGTNS